MTSVFRATVLRTLALSASAIALAPAALAGPVCDPTNTNEICIDFESLGEQALKDPKLPIEVVDPVSGVYFRGAYAYEWNMLTGNDTNPAAGNDGGFLMNRNRGASSTSDIVISLEELVAATARNVAMAGAFPGQFFASISFSLFSTSDEGTLRYEDASGVTQSIELTDGDDNKFWSYGNFYSFSSQDQITKLTFSANQGVLGLDDLKITLTDATPGGTVPEPSSYALVGLALLAAGSASRRRR